MKTFTLRTLAPLALCAATLALASCGQQDRSATESDAAAKVPVTTSSIEARQHYMAGRALMDDLHTVEANEAFAKAVEADGRFAMAYFMLAATAQTTADFFAAVADAELQAENASAGEQLFVAAMVAASSHRSACRSPAS